MPRFYFHLFDDVDANDDEGIELGSLDSAIEHSRRASLFTASETLKSTGRIVLSNRIEVEDEQHSMVHTMYLRDVIKIAD